MGSALRIGCILIVRPPAERDKTQLPLNLPLGVQIAHFVPPQVLGHLHLLAWQDIASQYSLGPGFESLRVHQKSKSEDLDFLLYNENHAIVAWFNRG